jgi:hypothetical protein
MPGAILVAISGKKNSQAVITASIKSFFGNKSQLTADFNELWVCLPAQLPISQSESVKNDDYLPLIKLLKTFSSNVREIAW